MTTPPFIYNNFWVPGTVTLFFRCLYSILTTSQLFVKRNKFWHLLGRMSLLLLPNEILIGSILSCDNITLSDMFQLSLSCRQLHDTIIESNQLWMCKFSTKWWHWLWFIETWKNVLISFLILKQVAWNAQQVVERKERSFLEELYV